MLLQPLVTGRNLSNRPIRFFCTHAPFVPQDKQSDFSNSSYSHSKPQNMVSKCVPRTQSMPSKIIRICCINFFQKLRDPNLELMLLQPLVTVRNLSNRLIRFFCTHAPFVPQDKQSDSSNSSYSNSKPPKYSFQMRP